jgi:hypothetical protein
MEHLMAWDMPESEKTIDRLTGEFISILSAGTFTTARTLVTIVYYAVAHPEVGEKLTESVREVMKDYPEKMPKWSDLEKIPYLAAVVREGLRYVPLSLVVWWATLMRLVQGEPGNTEESGEVLAGCGAAVRGLGYPEECESPSSMHGMYRLGSYTMARCRRA